MTPLKPGILRIDLPMEAIAAFCRKWKVAGLSIFGSVLRDDFRPDSDVDFLATFHPDAAWSLMDHARMEIELEELLGRKVDLVSMQGISESQNPIRKRMILSSARQVYAA